MGDVSAQPVRGSPDNSTFCRIVKSRHMEIRSGTTLLLRRLSAASSSGVDSSKLAGGTKMPVPQSVENGSLGPALSISALPLSPIDRMWRGLGVLSWY